MDFIVFESGSTCPPRASLDSADAADLVSPLLMEEILHRFILTSDISSVLALSAVSARRKAVIIVVQFDTPIAVGAAVSSLTRFLSDVVHVKLLEVDPLRYRIIEALS